MAETLIDILNECFQDIGVGRGGQERATALKEARTTYSKIINGSLALSQDRAERWARQLAPDSPERQAELVERMLRAAQALGRPQSVDQFCEIVMAEGGAVGGERVSELLDVLARERHPLVCAEYRDVPRAGRAGKYEGIGELLGKAIARGLTYAMFQPFGSDPPFPPDDRKPQKGLSTQSFVAVSYMRQVREKCRGAYLSFRRYAEMELERLQGDTTAAGTAQDSTPPDERPATDRIRLYERKSEKAGLASYLGSGFQANLFYIEWLDKEEVKVRHQRIFHWVSTPTRDLFIYRGQAQIDPEAIRDTFYPIPHFFDLDPQHRLPEPGHAAERVLAQGLPEQRGLPFQYDVWEAYGETGTHQTR